eukprot:352414-Chlamydomonas_euryale.AAC.1
MRGRTARRPPLSPHNPTLPPLHGSRPRQPPAPPDPGNPPCADHAQGAQRGAGPRLPRRLPRHATHGGVYAALGAGVRCERRDHVADGDLPAGLWRRGGLRGAGPA